MSTADEQDQTGIETEVETEEVANPVPAAPASPLAGLMKAISGNKPAPAAPAKAGAAKPPAKPNAAQQQKAMQAQIAQQQQMVNPGKPPPIQGPLVTIVTRNEFYRDGFRNLIKIAALQGIVIIGLILTLIVYINNNVSQDRYFATTADGRIMQLQPLDRPNLDTPALMSWVATAAAEVMTFTYTDYQKRLQQASRHFTKIGWETFTTAMQKSRILDSVQAQAQLVSAQPKSAPVLMSEGILGGKYRWVIQMPLQVTYRNGANTRSDTLQLNLVVERVPSLENPYGVGIAQWIATSK